MSEQKQKDLEFEQLGKLVKSKKTVIIFTRNGYQLKGTIQDYDSNVIIGNMSGERQMIYRDNISSILL